MVYTVMEAAKGMPYTPPPRPQPTVLVGAAQLPASYCRLQLLEQISTLMCSCRLSIPSNS